MSIDEMASNHITEIVVRVQMSKNEVLQKIKEGATDGIFSQAEDVAITTISRSLHLNGEVIEAIQESGVHTEADEAVL
ncbi:MAG: hypothetical protein AAGJ95_13960 [Cyanobacteria bacterium J06554_11]